MEALRALDLSPEAEKLYLELLQHPVEHPQPQYVDELVALGLVELSNDGVVVRPPRLALDALAEQHARRAALVRESGEVLTELWRAASGKHDHLELLPTYDAVQSVIDSVQTDAQHHVRAMTMGTIMAPREIQIVTGLFDALKRGVRYDVIYGAHVLQDAAALHMAQQCIDAGEQARVFPRVPLNLTLVDHRWALVAARSAEARPEFVAMVVHESALLEGLEGIFDALWRIAVPITNTTELNDVEAGPSLESKRLLTYLSAGLTDESIAREVGVSERTIARRIGRLQEALGAQTRFQLGVQASRQGWL
ncbi:hypothetical protein ACFCV3_07805 [Kribbella sp. NPDC056345]|uniref:hypothetical protein n=1 Tax=Kribbella sp. NPDC056345 TaxID=3345789 RepID=UPI0035E37820